VDLFWYRRVLAIPLPFYFTLKFCCPKKGIVIFFSPPQKAWAAVKGNCTKRYSNNKFLCTINNGPANVHVCKKEIEPVLARLERGR
jgi:hypothetical protein